MATLVGNRYSAGIGTDHPELLPGEIFICYEILTNTKDMELPGKRFGTRVFDDNGNEDTVRANQLGYVPVFANKAEHSKRYG